MSYLLDSLKKSEKERRENRSSSAFVMRSPAFLENDSPKTSLKFVGIILLCLMVMIAAYLAFSLLKSPKVSDVSMESSNLSDKALGSKEASLSAKGLSDSALSDNVLSDKALSEKESAVALYNQVLINNSKTDIDSLYDEVEASSRLVSSQTAKLDVPASKIASVSEIKISDSGFSDVEPSTLELSRDELNDQVDTPLVVNEEPEITDLVEQPIVRTEPSIPSIYDIDAYIRKDIPSIDYGAHIYATDNNSGFVILDGARRRAGDRLESGLFVEKIGEESVVLNFNGVLFSLPAMKSWQGK